MSQLGQIEPLVPVQEITEPLAIKDSGNIQRFNEAAERNLGDLRGLSLGINTNIVPGINAVVALINQQLPYINTVSAADAEIRTNANNIANINTLATHIAALLAVNLRLTEVQVVADNMASIIAVFGQGTEIAVVAANMPAVLAAPDAATAAEGSATTAATKAEEAATSANSALESKNSAALSETSALASAETAANSATVAQAAKAAAEAARDEAQDIANVGPATTVKLGLVKMDGKTTQADAGGVITVKDVAIGGDLADLASARGQIGDAKEMPNLDFNTLTTPGNYRITGNPTNGPSLPLNISGASIGSLIVAGTLGQNGRIFQIMISGSTVTWRTVQNSTGTTWSAWQQLLSGNKVGDGIRVTNGIISVPEMQGATASTSGTSGLVPPAAAGQQESFLTGGGEYKHITSLGPVSEKSQDLGTISGAVTIDLSAGLSVIATVGGATTLAFANVPAGGTVTVLLRLTNGGAYAVTWGMAPRWGNGIAPVLSESGADYIAFYHAEGEWTGLLVTSNVQ